MFYDVCPAPFIQLAVANSRDQDRVCTFSCTVGYSTCVPSLFPYLPILLAQILGIGVDITASSCIVSLDKGLVD